MTGVCCRSAWRGGNSEPGASMGPALLGPVRRSHCPAAPRPRPRRALLAAAARSAAAAPPPAPPRAPRRPDRATRPTPRPLRNSHAPPAPSTSATVRASTAPRDPRVVLVRDVYVGGHERPHPELCPALGARLRLLVLVTSAPAHAAARDAVRLTWGHYAARADVALAFVLGAPPDALRPALAAEDAMYGDLVVGRSVDSYSNLTLKTLSMLEWADTYCPRAPRLLKTDDDMFINVPRLLEFAAAPGRANATRTIWGKVVRRSLPKRTTKSKYYLSPLQYPARVLPDFATGPAYLLTADCVGPLLAAAPRERYVRLEDVFVTGVLAARLVPSQARARVLQQEGGAAPVRRAARPGHPHGALPRAVRPLAQAAGRQDQYKAVSLRDYSRVCRVVRRSLTRSARPRVPLCAPGPAVRRGPTQCPGPHSVPRAPLSAPGPRCRGPPSDSPVQTASCVIDTVCHIVHVLYHCAEVVPDLQLVKSFGVASVLGRPSTRHARRSMNATGVSATSKYIIGQMCLSRDPRRSFNIKPAEPLVIVKL
ncbi:hypothetical protein SFRURICE_012112 [Spodoptera frugiperda]|nr:hypothetical protein SFRURICE_012112 [Spodoptera frugiperda]